MKRGFAELGSVAEFINGAAFKPQDWGDKGKRIVRIQNLTDSSKPFNRTNRKVAEKLHVHPGDLLVSWSASLGVFEWSEPDVALLNQHIFRVVPDETRVEKRYLRHGLERALLEMQPHLHGATMQHVNRGEFLATKLYLPPLAEQRRIAEILDKADALRTKRRAALAQLDTLTQSIFLDLFGDPVRNEKGWPIGTVSNLCELVRGSSPRPQGDPRFFGGPVPRLMVADITRDGWLVTPRIDSLTVEGARRSRPVLAGTVVMAVSGNVGLVSRLAIDACVHDGFVAFTKLDESRCESGFLLALLHFSKALHEKHKAGAIFINLTTTDIKAMRLPLPPIDLQREFLRRVGSVDRLKSAQRASLAELGGLFATLQHRAFRGGL